MCACAFVCACARAFVCAYVHVYVCMRVCTCVYVHRERKKEIMSSLPRLMRPLSMGQITLDHFPAEQHSRIITDLLSDITHRPFLAFLLSWLLLPIEFQCSGLISSG